MKPWNDREKVRTTLENSRQRLGHGGQVVQRIHPERIRWTYYYEREERDTNLVGATAKTT